MTPDQAGAASRKAVARLGTAYLECPRTLRRARELGLTGWAAYVAGRGGALGDVRPDTVAAALGLIAPEAVRSGWSAARAVLSPPEVAAQMLAECCRWGAEHLEDAPGIARLVTLLETVAVAADSAGLALFAAWRAMPLPGGRVRFTHESAPTVPAAHVGSHLGSSFAADVASLAVPFSAPPLIAAPTSPAPIPAPPVSAPPISAPPYSAQPTSAPPVTAVPLSSLPTTSPASSRLAPAAPASSPSAAGSSAAPSSSSPAFSSSPLAPGSPAAPSSSSPASPRGRFAQAGGGSSAPLQGRLAPGEAAERMPARLAAADDRDGLGPMARMVAPQQCGPGPATSGPLDGPGARAAVALHLLAEHRAGAMLIGIRAAGLTPVQALIAGPEGEAAAVAFGWQPPYPAPGPLLRRRAWADSLTDHMCGQVFQALSEVERAELVSLLQKALAHVSR